MKSKITISDWTFNLPRTRFFRTIVGVALILGGVLGFLPVVGFWMVPLGLLVLSTDWAFARRLKRRAAVCWGRRRQKNNNNNHTSGKL